MTLEELLESRGCKTMEDYLILVTDTTTRLKDCASVLGSIKSEAKAKASRENGKKGGRPKKS